MDEATIKNVDCIRLYVDTLASGLAFYRDRLGLDLIWRTERAIGLRLPEDGTEIVLHTERKPPEIAGKRSRPRGAQRHVRASRYVCFTHQPPLRFPCSRLRPFDGIVSDWAIGLASESRKSNTPSPKFHR